MKIAQKLLITIAGSLLSFLVINLLIVNIQTTELTNEIISENLLSKIHGDINATNAILSKGGGFIKKRLPFRVALCFT